MASALAEIMQADLVLREAVVPYLDVGAAAEVLCRLVAEPTLHLLQAQAARRLVEALPDIASYAQILAGLGEQANADMQASPKRQALLEQADNFDSGLYSSGLMPDAARRNT